MHNTDFNGVRNVPVRFQVSELEHNLLTSKAQCCAMSKSDYIRELICESLPSEAPPKEFYLACNDLNKIGVNLNQIAKRINTYNQVTEEEYQTVCGYAEEVINLLKDIKELVAKPKLYHASVYDEYAYAQREAKKQGKPIPRFGDDISEYREVVRYKMAKDHPEEYYFKRTDEMLMTEEESGAYGGD